MLIVTTYFFLGYLWVSNHVLNEILHSVQMPDNNANDGSKLHVHSSSISGEDFVYLLSLHISVATD